MSDRDDAPAGAGVEPAVVDGVLRLRRPGTRWLSTGFEGGVTAADAAYNVTVPEGWPETDLAAYVRERRRRAGFTAAGPALLTGVRQTHARVATRGPVTAVATAGLSNPAALPVDGAADRAAGGRDAAATSADAGGPDDGPHVGTVNLFVVAARALPAGALANLVAVAAEAKAATLLARTGFPGTTTDAVVAGCDPDAEPARFSGSATAVGAAARACVRDALAASLDSWDGAGEAGTSVPDSVADADHGVVTDGRAAVRRVDGAPPDGPPTDGDATGSRPGADPRAGDEP